MKTIYCYKTSILQFKRVIIYGCLKEAREFAIRLLNENIYFHNFLIPSAPSCCSINEVRLLNKECINYEQCRELKDIVIVAPYFAIENARKELAKEHLDKYLVELETIQPTLKNASSIIVWGTGSLAKRFYEDFGEEFNIDFFCDSDKKKVNKIFFDKKIISFDKLADLPKDTVCIIASVFYDDIKGKVQNYIEKNFIYAVPYHLILKKNNKEIWRGHHVECIVEAIRDISGKKVILYGQENTVHAINEKLNLLDLSVDKNIVRKSLSEDGTIYQLLYYITDDSMVVLTDKYSDNSNKILQELGLRCNQCVWLGEYRSFLVYKSTQLIDPNLGINYHSNGEEYVGFTRFEYLDSIDSKPIVIATLGGSTTCACDVTQRTWSEFLSNILKRKKIPHKIYCGGMHGYGVQQELIKLLRDVLLIKPDLVISYSGVNNMSVNLLKNHSNYLFISPFQEVLFEKILELDASDNSKFREISYGIPSKEDSFENWFFYERMMNLICSDLGIGFKAILQPILYSTEGVKDFNAILSSMFAYETRGNKQSHITPTDMYRISTNDALHFREQAKQKTESWFSDFSSIFDGKDEIYIDDCHVYEKGNQIIATKIYEIIKKPSTSIHLNDVLN